MKRAFIHFKPDGFVHIEGGVVFYPIGDGKESFVVYGESPPAADGSKHVVNGVKFITRLPRWYQLRDWLRVIREVVSVMSRSAP